MSEDPRLRILAATVDALGRSGLARTTVDDIARGAGVSRATVYRHFPDGKDELIAAGVERAVADFFWGIAGEIDDAADLTDLLERALLVAHRAVLDHEILQTVARTDPERLMPQLSEAAPLVREMITVYLTERLQDEELRPGLTPVEAASWLARMLLSFLFDGGIWDLEDPASVRRLIRGELVRGILADPPVPDPTH